MKRDFELVRKILSETNDLPAAKGGFTLEIEGYEKAVVDEHIELLIEAGLVSGKVIRGTEEIVCAYVTRLTWYGHDFFAATSDKPLWQKAKKLLLDQGGAITFDLLFAWIKKEASERIGLV